MSQLGKAGAISLIGLRGYPVEVEAHLAAGLPGFSIVGLPDTSLRESRDRVRAALGSCAVEWPDRRCTINLSPAQLPKNGSGFDLAIAVSLAVAGNQAASTLAAKTMFLGELGLDGRIHPVRGILPSVAAAAKAGFSTIVVPSACQTEAKLVEGIEVIGAGHLSAVLTWLGIKCQQKDYQPVIPAPVPDALAAPLPPNLGDVRGQPEARYALEVAAAGGHHLFLLGVPGAGKTLLASCLPSILPDLTPSQAVEVTSIHSLAGQFNAAQGLIRRPPFIAPHHGATAPALLGGGSAIARPGAVSLAHHGVLFLDEAPEFAPKVLDGLRQPLEEGALTIHRALAAVRMPAKFQLVLAANPCPCGKGVGNRACSCSALQKRRYLARLSGPLLDRIDIRIEMLGPTRGSLAIDTKIEDSATVAKRVKAAQLRARKRWKGYPWSKNSDIPGSFLRSPESGFPKSLRNDLDRAVENGNLSMRGADRVARLAWTITDLNGGTYPTSEEIAVAMTLRQPAYH